MTIDFWPHERAGLRRADTSIASISSLMLHRLVPQIQYRACFFKAAVLRALGEVLANQIYNAPIGTASIKPALSATAMYARKPNHVSRAEKLPSPAAPEEVDDSQ